MLLTKENAHPGSASSSLVSGLACCFTNVPAATDASADPLTGVRLMSLPAPWAAAAPNAAEWHAAPHLAIPAVADQDDVDPELTDDGPTRMPTMNDECTSPPPRLAPALADLIASSLQQGTPRRLSVSSAGPASPGLFGSPSPTTTAGLALDESRKRSAAPFAAGAAAAGPAPARRRVSAPGGAWGGADASGGCVVRPMAISPVQEHHQQQQQAFTEPPGVGGPASARARRLGALRPLRLDFDVLAPTLATLTPRGLASPLAVTPSQQPPRLPPLSVPEPTTAAAGTPIRVATTPQTVVAPSPKDWIDLVEAQLSSRRRSSSSGGSSLGGAQGLVPPAFVCLGLMGARGD